MEGGSRSPEIQALVPPRLGPAGAGGQLLLAAIFLAAYVALEWISFIHEYKGVPITPWNPGLGAVFALMILAGPRYAAVLFAGVVIAEKFMLQTTLQWPTVLGIAAIFAAVYGGAAHLARTRLRLDLELDHLRDMTVLLGCGFLGALVSALLVSIPLYLDPQLSLSEVALAAVPLLVGDTIGIAVMTPLLLRTALRDFAAGISRRFFAELAFCGVLIALSLWAIVNAGNDGGFKFFYLLFVPVVLAALRHGLNGACVALATAQFGLVGVLHFYDTGTRAFTEFQLLMLALSATGLIVGVVVAERRTADRLMREAQTRIKEKESEAAQAARFSLVSGMAAALAHEINQPMTAARALGRSVQELLRKPDADLARADANLSNMIVQVDHAGSIVRRMREFLRRGHPRVSTIFVSPMLEGAMVLAKAEARAHRVTVELAVQPSLPPVHGDSVQLQQVVLNLLRNSIDAIDAAGITDGIVRVSAALGSDGKRIEIALTDNGPGVDSEAAERLFKPLRSSKHEGLGLGLATSLWIVESHGGKLWLHSGEPGKTEFRFFIPLDTA